MHDTDIMPVIDYNGWKLRDISRRFIIRYIESRNTKPYWFEHRLKGWKSIENVAFDFYGSCDYIWAIMIANNIVHPVEDWLKKEDDVIAYASKKYGANNLHTAHHYEFNGIRYNTRMKTIIDARKTSALYGHVIPQDVYEQIVRANKSLSTPVSVDEVAVVTNIQWEMSLNEKKRIVRIIYPSLLQDIEKQMEKLL